MPTFSHTMALFTQLIAHPGPLHLFSHLCASLGYCPSCPGDCDSPGSCFLHIHFLPWKPFPLRRTRVFWKRKAEHLISRFNSPLVVSVSSLLRLSTVAFETDTCCHYPSVFSNTLLPFRGPPDTLPNVCKQALSTTHRPWLALFSPAGHLPHMFSRFPFLLFHIFSQISAAQRDRSALTSAELPELSVSCCFSPSFIRLISKNK